MNSVQASLLALGLVLIYGTYSGEAVMCHVCNSDEKYEGKGCSDPISEDAFLVDCKEYGIKHNYPGYINATLCRKQFQTVGSDSRTVRSCAIEGRLDRCVDRTGTKAVKVTYCECEGDGCNGTSGMFASVLLVTITALLAKALH